MLALTRTGRTLYGSGRVKKGVLSVSFDKPIFPMGTYIIVGLTLASNEDDIFINHTRKDETYVFTQ